MTREELKSLISECIAQEREIQDYRAMYESYMMLENSLYQDIINTYSSTEAVYESYMEFLDEAFVVGKASYNTEEEAKKAIDKELAGIKDKIAQYKTKIADVKANPSKYDDDALEVLTKKLKHEEELISNRETYFKNELNKQIEAAKNGAAEVANKAANATENGDVAKAAANLKNPETKQALTNAVASGTSENASKEEVQEKAAEEVAKKFPGLKAVKGSIVSTFKGENGKGKQALAIAALATAVVGSITAAVMIRKKKKAKEEEKS